MKWSSEFEGKKKVIKFVPDKQLKLKLPINNCLFI